MRLIHGDENPEGPGFRAEEVEADVNGSRAGTRRELAGGSYIRLERDGPLRCLRSFTLSAWIYPTGLGRGVQAIMGAWGLPGPGYCLLVGDGGSLELHVADAMGASRAFRAAHALSEREWQFVAASFNAETRRMTLFQHRHSLFDPSDRISMHDLPDMGALADAASPFLIAAHAAPSELGGLTTRAHFNGKIESPAVRSIALGAPELPMLQDASADADTVAAWDFSAMQTSRTVLDTSRSGLLGRTVNLPTRGVTGRRWDGSSVSFRERPDMYAAIHFHDDDLDDAGWPTEFVWAIPPTTRSGIYAARLRTDDGGLDHVPVFVRPNREAALAPVLVLLPTFSYLAYANDHNAKDPALRESLEIPADFVYPAQDEDRYILASGLTGMYDLHTDGSPVVYSSRMRPIMNMRPTYRQPLLNNGLGGPHQLAADLHLVDWLEHFKYPYDVATDEDLHHSGLACLAPYRVVITGTHPEYWSGQALERQGASPWTRTSRSVRDTRWELPTRS